MSSRPPRADSPRPRARVRRAIARTRRRLPNKPTRGRLDQAFSRHIEHIDGARARHPWHDPDRFRLTYGVRVLVSVRPAFPRWVSLVVLAFAVACMHSLVTLEPAHMPDASMVIAGTDAAAMPATDPGCDTDQGPCSGHSHDMDMTHMCLAVLVALAGLVVGWLRWRGMRTSTRGHGRNPRFTRLGRGPPPPVRILGDLVTSLCVLRR